MNVGEDSILPCGFPDPRPLDEFQPAERLANSRSAGFAKDMLQAAKDAGLCLADGVGGRVEFQSDVVCGNLIDGGSPEDLP